MLVAILALVWFAPVFAGDAFTTVPTHQTAVYPWHGVLRYRGDNYAQSDQADLNAPWESIQTAAVREGTVAFWNPESFGGAPLFANGSSGALYPPRLLLNAVASPEMTHNLLSMLHVAGAGVFGYLLLLDLGVSAPAAVLGAVAWMFGTFTLDWIQLEVVAPVFMWLPAGLWAIRRAVAGSRRAVVAAGAAMALTVLGAHLLFAELTCAAVVLYGAASVAETAFPSGADSTAWRHRLAAGAARVAAAAGLGVGLAGVVLVPTAEALAGAHRAPFSYSTLTKQFLLAPSALRYLLFAPPHGTGVSAEVHMHQAAFVGTLTVLFAAVGACLRRPGSGLGRGLVAVTVLVAVGGPATWLAYHLVPGMNAFRPYSRLLFLTDLGVAILGAVGFDWILRRATRSAGRPGHHPLAARLMAAGAVAVVAVTALQLGLYGRAENPPFASPRSIYPTTPLLRAVERSGGGWPHRVLPLRLDVAHPPVLFAGESVVFGIASAGGYDSVVPPRTTQIWDVSRGLAPAAVIGRPSPQDYLPTWELAGTRFDLLPRLGIDRIVSSPEVLVDSAAIYRLEAMGWARKYEGPDGILWVWTGAPVGPRVVGQATVVRGDRQALEAFTSPAFDADREVVVESAGRLGEGDGGGGHVTAARHGVNSAVISVASAGGYLVVPDMWDAGWSATVNGAAAPVLRANFNQQAVKIPAGRVTVRLRFRPPGLVPGALVTFLAVIAAAAVIAGPRQMWRRLWPEEVQA